MPSRTSTIFHLPSTILLTLFLAVGAVQAQNIRVLASVDETTIGTEETVVYTIDIQNASQAQVETPQPPQTEGLALVSRFPSMSSQTTIVNGNIQRSIGFSWTYRPVAEGQARIEPNEVTVGGQTYTTEPIQLTVVPQGQRPQRRARRNDPFGGTTNPFNRTDPAEAEEPPEVSSRDIFIRAVPDKREVFQNGQVTISYQLFFRDGIQLRQSRLTDSWDAEGFWREDLDVEPRPIPRPTVEDGVRYNMITLKRVAVFPTRAGDLRIDPLRIESEVYVPYRSRDPFDAFFSRRNRYQPVELASGSVSVASRPLPDGAPEGFRGAVGSFSMDVAVDRTEVDVGESVQLVVTLSGSGNLATLDAPTLDVPGVFEVYDPQVAMSINRGSSRIRGSKTFTYILVPRSNGTFDVPPVTFSYLGTDGIYATERSPSFPITVTGTVADLPAATATASGLPVDDIAGPLMGVVRWVSARPAPLHVQPWVYLLLGAPLLVLGGLALVRQHATRLATDTTFARNRRAHPLARKHLKAAQKLLDANQPRDFYAALERAVLGFIGDRLDIAERGFTRPQLDEYLAGTGVAADLRRDLRHLLDECDQMRFAPVAPDRATMEAAAERAASLIVAYDAALFEPSTPSA